MKPRTTFLQKIALISFGILCCIILLETGLRLGGLGFVYLQKYRNRLSIKQKGAYRIICLGESTTANQYPPFLEEVLNQRNIGIKFSVIDGGVPGANASFISDRLESNLDTYRPDMVITMMGINDWGQHLPFEATSDSKILNFLRSFKVYKLTRLLWLHMVTRFQLHAGKEGAPANEELIKIEKTAELNPEGDGYVDLGCFYQDLGRLSEAEASFKKAIELNPRNDEAYRELGWLYQDLAKLSEAEASFKKAIELNPKNDEGYLDLGCFYQDLAKLSEAEASFKKAIELNPENDEAYCELGWFYHDLAKLSEAEASFKKAIELNPRNDEAYVGLGWFYQDLRRVSESEASFKKATDNPEGDGYVYLGCFYLDLAKLSEAEALFKKAIELNPENDEAYRGLGWFYRDLGRLSEAEVLFKKAVELNPRNDEAYNTLGCFYLNQGRLSEAEALFKKAIEFNPLRAYRAHGALKVLYSEMGNSGLAGEYDKKAKELGWGYYTQMTIINYHKLKAILDKRGIAYVCVQYPMRNIEPLKKIFQGDAEGIIFVDNEAIFKNALKQGSCRDYFRDMFGGDFGHCTEKGNRLLAENIANVILKEVFSK